jgi:hypothetical protein
MELAELILTAQERQLPDQETLVASAYADRLRGNSSWRKSSTDLHFLHLDTLGLAALLSTFSVACASNSTKTSLVDSTSPSSYLTFTRFNTSGYL